MKKKKVLTVFLLFIYAVLNAQTAQEIQTLLQTPVVSYQQAARFVLAASDVIDDNDEAARQGAMSFAVASKWLPENAGADDPISLERLSHLIMKAFGVKGGPMYSLFNSAHYSYREMVFKDIIQGRSDPQMKVSGYTMMFIVNRMLFYIEKNPWKLPPAAQETGREEDIAMAKEINTQLEAMGVADTNVRVTNEGVTISVSNIQFLANSAELPEKEKQTLAEIAQILKSIPGRRILVVGHTALAGTERDRLRTSRDRAWAVADYLVLLGARRTDEIAVAGYGSDRPIADNSTPQGMALNRRVEITLLGDVQ
ncbi:MAG: OmpA family protein [Treponema sp.]|jgi:outer membrane protein OmpA-like peptidoglycan-associated protein|nr:OmpA family protein [Treponema sp.]